MHTDMITRKTTSRIWTMFGLCALGLYITACDNEELSGNGQTPANIDLRFTASISDSPFTKTVHGPDMTKTSFLVGDELGMFITKDGGGAVVDGSGDNMKSILTQDGDSAKWTHTGKNNQMLSLKANLGENINITGYYPWMKDATERSVSFDLTGDPSTWKDLLYLSSSTGTQPVEDGGAIQLTFSHAFSWVTIKLSKTDQSDLVVTAVSIENSHDNLERIMTKGNMNPKTGNVEGTTFGSLVIGCNPNVNLPENGYTPAEFNFLVPPFMNTDVQDSDIVIRVTTETSGTKEVLSFPLRKTHLNNANTNQYGFEKGKHNTYNLIYNNSEMLLSLSDWQEAVIGEMNLGEGAAGVQPISVELNLNYFPSGDKADIQKNILETHINHTYLGEVSDNNNGKYLTIPFPEEGNLGERWAPIMKNEPFFKKLLVARNDAAGGALIPWKDAYTGVLTAKQACLEFKEGGYKDWRLPRISELFSIALHLDKPLGTKSYWSATESDSTTGCSVMFFPDMGYKTGHYPQRSSKQEAFYIRCVRDEGKPKPTI